MPWTPTDALRHTKFATSPAAQRQWADVANSALARHNDEGRAIREANAVVANRRAKTKTAIQKRRSGK